MTETKFLKKLKEKDSFKEFTNQQIKAIQKEFLNTIIESVLTEDKVSFQNIGSFYKTINKRKTQTINNKRYKIKKPINLKFKCSPNLKKFLNTK